jgi:quercetin dioxygenase-like cupin family protein
MAADSKRTRVLTLDDSCPEMRLVEGDGRAVALVWPGVGATQRSMHHIALHPGDHTVPQRHPQEAVYYVKTGGGTVLDPDAGTSDALVEGSMIHIEPGTAYRFKAGIEGLELLGGPCPPDPDLYSHL